MNLVLIGMPGAGKSTVGVLLAKTLGMGFVDTDLVIQTAAGQLLYEVIDQKGMDQFLALENRVVSELTVDRCVIATGGSVIYSADAMQRLKTIGKIIYIRLPGQEIVHRVNNIRTRGIVMAPGEKLEDLYHKRDPLYQKYADVTADCTGNSVEETVEKIAEIWAAFDEAV